MPMEDSMRRDTAPRTAGQAELEGESLVAHCDATACLYNQAQQCNAGAINVSFMNGIANCATYTPRAEARGAAPGSGQSGMGVI